MSSIAIIPARGGSKRIPRKNIRDFCGKPIIAYSIEAAVKSGIFDEVMVSTDDMEIADLAKKFGGSVPFMRSDETSTDSAMTVPVLFEVLNAYNLLGRNFTYTCCIYPTAPFVCSDLLINAMKLLMEKNVDSVVPVVKFSYPPQRGFYLKNSQLQMIHPENYSMRSQDLEPIYHDSGQFYALKNESLLEQKQVFMKDTIGLELKESQVQDIDNEEDWKLAEIKYSLIQQ